MMPPDGPPPPHSDLRSSSATSMPAAWRGWSAGTPPRSVAALAQPSSPRTWTPSPTQMGGRTAPPWAHWRAGGRGRRRERRSQHDCKRPRPSSLGCICIPDTWQPACYLLAAGCWLLATGCCLLPAGCWVLPAGCWMLPAACWLLPAAYWLPSAALQSATWAGGDVCCLAFQLHSVQSRCVTATSIATALPRHVYKHTQAHCGWVGVQVRVLDPPMRHTQPTQNNTKTIRIV
jgi:hypothetical protein